MSIAVGPGTGAGTAAGVRPEKPAAQLAYLARAMGVPVIVEVYEHLAARARDEGWTYEEYLVAVVDRQVSAQAANGTQLRSNAAHFPVRKSLDEYDYSRNVGQAREEPGRFSSTSLSCADSLRSECHTTGNLVN